MQSLISGCDNDSRVLESRLIEGELDLQMALLKEQNSITDVSVFQTDEIDDDILHLPHLHGILHKPSPTDIYVFEETILEENLLEPIAICCAIVGLALLPQLM
jgi:hypothetical protein